MPTKKTAIYRTDLLPHGMNAGKEAQVRALLSAWRRTAVAQAREQWRLVFQTGRPSKRHDVSRTGYELLGTSYGQMVRAQVVGQLESFLSNRANDFKGAVNDSSLPPKIKHQLHFINRWQGWYDPAALTMKDGTTIPTATRRLARAIMRHILAHHRKPTLRRVGMVIDQRCITLTPATKTTSFPLWARLTTLTKGQRINVPLQTYPFFEQRVGQRALSVQVIDRDGVLSFGLMTDVSEAMADSRAAYVPRCEALALDLGLRTLFATDQGDLLGRNWLAQLRGYDARLIKLAAYRQRHGLKMRSPRYRRYVAALRGFVRSEVGRILNRLVTTHAPAEIVIERLNFRNPDLSRRLNRLLNLFGRGEVQRKLQDLTEKFGIIITEVNPAYSSQADAACGYVDPNNRPRQASFCCRWCGKTRHADVNAARNHLRRRSDAAIGDVWRPKQAILGEVVRRFTERFHRPRGRPSDPRLSNRYFAEWTKAVMLTAPSGATQHAASAG